MVRRTPALVVYLFLAFVHAAAAQAPAPTVRSPLSEHVILVSIDGLRADAIEKAGATTLQGLLARGSGTITAQTILPSRTLPSHVSMLTGLLPDAHGITWNTDKTDDLGTVTVPTVFELAHNAGYRTAAFLSKRKLRTIMKEGTLDEVRYPGFGVAPASRTVREASQYIRKARPNLLFVHIADADFMGHRMGWESIFYRWGVREADAGVRELMRAADETFGSGNYTIIVTADHGGHGKDHGTDHPEDMTIPWISFGRGIRAATPVVTPVRTTDTAATVLEVLGIAAPAGWSGVAVAAALSNTAVLAGPAVAAAGGPN
jgi:predicted AlkP superfamily pyrophosphatase or phosphodiesterase